MREVRLDARALPVRQDLVEVGDVGRPRLAHRGSVQLPAAEGGGGRRPAAVEPLQHLEEVCGRLRPLGGEGVAVVARHLEEAKGESRLVLPCERREVVRVVHVLLDNGVLDVGPEARVWEVCAPLGLEVVARAVRGRLGALVHEVRDVAPGELGDAELEPRSGDEEHLPPLRADGHDHVKVLEGEGGARVDDGADLVAFNQEAVVLDELGLRALLEVLPAVERAAEGVVVVHRHPLRRAILDQPQIRLRGVRGERAVRLGLVQHRGGEGVRRVDLLVRLEAAQQLAAEEGVEGVPVVVHQVRVLGLDVRDGVDPALHRRHTQRQRQQRHLLPPR
mmetsp:Transcript_34295/g.110145  ORF Transcript_34295/g.110145 Transcript_34295/m.110145 type:complete len:334 (-) Transcript_34295:524-1525(-)